MLRFIAFVSLYLLSVLPVSAEGQDYLSFVTEEYRPYNYTEEGKLTGLSVEVLRLMWDVMGAGHQDIVSLPWARGMRMLETGPGVVLFGAGWSEERARRFKFVMPFQDERIVIMARREMGRDDIKWKTANDFAEAMVGSVRSDATEQAAIDMGLDPRRLDRAVALETNVQKFLAGRYTYIIGAQSVLEKAFARAGEAPGAFHVVYELSRSTNGYMFSADVSDEIVEEYQRALDAVRKTEAFDALMERFLK